MPGAIAEDARADAWLVSSTGSRTFRARVMWARNGRDSGSWPHAESALRSVDSSIVSPSGVRSGADHNTRGRGQ